MGRGQLLVFPLVIGIPSAGNFLPGADAEAPCSCCAGLGA